jgi:hypothetical protein
MAFITDEQYYTNGGNSPTDQNWGSYQYISIKEVVDNFEMLFVGNENIIKRMPRYKILALAKLAIKNLNYHAFNSTKVLELTMDGSFSMVLPPDYVDYIRISVNVDGVLYPLTQNSQLNYANSYLQDSNNDIVFDMSGNVIETQSQLDMDRMAGMTQQLYTGPGPYNGSYGWDLDGTWYFSRSFGRTPENMFANGTFRIDKQSGVINFSTDLEDKNVVIEYVSDGLEKGDITKMRVHKFAEQAVYAFINSEYLRNLSGAPMYEKKAAQQKYRAEYRNAKIAMSDLKPSRLLMVLRNQGKWQK